jgi:peptide/nickel transport system substrate-binding protein
VLGSTSCGDLVNALVDTSKYLPHSANLENYGNFEDPTEVTLYDKMLREPDAAKQRALMRQFEKYVMDDQAHELMTLWWYRIVPYRSCVKGWNISPSHFLENDLARVWLDK